MLKDAYFQIKMLVSDVISWFSKEDPPKSTPTKITIPLVASPKKSLERPLPSIPTRSVQAINNFFTQNKGVMHKFFMKKLDKAIHQNQNVIELFRLGDTDIVAKLVEENYEPLLDDALKYFIEIEDYKMAKKCQKLKDEYHINKLLKSTHSK